MNKIDFTFSDLIAGYVTSYDQASDSFGLKTSDGREYTVHIAVNCYAELVRNLGEAFHDASGPMREMLTPDRFLFAYGIFYPDGTDGDCRFDVKHIVLLAELRMNISSKNRTGGFNRFASWPISISTQSSAMEKSIIPRIVPIWR